MQIGRTTFHWGHGTPPGLLSPNFRRAESSCKDATSAQACQIVMEADVSLSDECPLRADSGHKGTADIFTGRPRFCSRHWPCDRSICAKTSSTLKLEGFCRGGKSLNVTTNCCTSAWDGTIMNARWIAQS